MANKRFATRAKARIHNDVVEQVQAYDRSRTTRVVDAEIAEAFIAEDAVEAVHDRYVKLGVDRNTLIETVGGMTYQLYFAELDAEERFTKLIEYLNEQ